MHRSTGPCDVAVHPDALRPTFGDSYGDQEFETFIQHFPRLISRFRLHRTVVELCLSIALELMKHILCQTRNYTRIAAGDGRLRQIHPFLNLRCFMIIPPLAILRTINYSILRLPLRHIASRMMERRDIRAGNRAQENI